MFILGSGCSLHRGVTILSGTRIGRGVKLYRDVYCGKNTIIGDYSSINRYSIVDCGSIGNFSSIGPNCLIGAGKHAIKYISTSQRVYGKNNILGISTPFEAFDSPPIIGHDVWIGNNVTVMQGVSAKTFHLILYVGEYLRNLSNTVLAKNILNISNNLIYGVIIKIILQ